MEELGSGLLTLLSSTVIVAIVSVGLFVVHNRLLAMYADAPSKQFRRQLTMLACVIAGVLLVITLIPVSPTLKGQLVGLLGLLLSATIALSSTTLVGNAMAGIMLKVVKNCRPGDFIRVGDYFGRVTEMDLLHTEIQTEDRDLTTFPNLYLVTNPVTVKRSSGSIVSVELSLGYEYSRTKIESLLIEAAKDSGLDDPFVQIKELGDFAITYRIAGLLTDVKKLLATRRAVRARVLDTLHDAGVEIVSPTFMNTKALAKNQQMIPEKAPRETNRQEGTGKSPDSLVFDKAEKAESVEHLRSKYESTSNEIKKIEQSIAESEDTEKALLQEQLKTLTDKSTRLMEIIQRAEEKLADQD